MRPECAFAILFTVLPAVLWTPGAGDPRAQDAAPERGSDCNSNGISDGRELVPPLSLGSATSLTVEGFPCAFACVDLDGDGDLDIAVANRDAGSVSVLLQAGGREFTRGGDYPAGDRPCAVVAADLDGVFLLDYLFQEGTPPGCVEAGDANGDGAIDISDPIRVLSFLFLDGLPLPPPGSAQLPCGPDPDRPGSRGDLGCESYESCE
ncbi:MAG: FG-GAP-like repeat-containing protein [Planctomycetota bacterium]|nr:FG-GAP-like repeat-containing protein [Planctomycetota bacterium]